MSTAIPQILVVDDRPENLIVIESVLENLNIEILKASSGAQALELMLNHTFSLVILDVQMPEMDGFEVVDLMKRREKTRNIPVIFVTAISKEKWSVYKGYEVGAVDYLFKPIEPVILRSKVKVFIELYMQRKQLEEQKIMLEEKIVQLKQMGNENRELERLSMFDGLTELPNRRSFNFEMEKLWKASERNKTPFSMMMIDIDWFKNYNDKFGHLQGDDALRTVARVLNNALMRPLDFVARFGGEEFVILLPDVNQKGARLKAEELIRAIESAVIEHEGSDKTSMVTISIGLSSIEYNSGFSMNAFINKADEALYLAKTNGRNRYEYLGLEQ